MSRLFGLFIAMMISLGLMNMAAMAGDDHGLVVKKSWMRLNIPGRPAAAFMIIGNHQQADKLVKATAEKASKVELHTHIHENGVMKMREIPEIDIPAKGMVQLQPGGYHLMLFGVEKSVKPGDEMMMELEFASGRKLSVSVRVYSLNKMPKDAMSHGHDGDKKAEDGKHDDDMKM